MEVKDKKYLDKKLDTICAILGGVYTNGYFTSQLGHKVDTSYRDSSMKEIEKIILQIYKRGKKAV